MLLVATLAACQSHAPAPEPAVLADELARAQATLEAGGFVTLDGLTLRAKTVVRDGDSLVLHDVRIEASAGDGAGMRMTAERARLQAAPETWDLDLAEVYSVRGTASVRADKVRLTLRRSRS
jgi:hypothetical protein